MGGQLQRSGSSTGGDMSDRAATDPDGTVVTKAAKGSVNDVVAKLSESLADWAARVLPATPRV